MVCALHVHAPRVTVQARPEWHYKLLVSPSLSGATMNERTIPRPYGLQPQALCIPQGPSACFISCVVSSFHSRNRRDSQEFGGACPWAKVSNLGCARCRGGPTLHSIDQCLQYSGTDHNSLLACLCFLQCRYGKVALSCAYKHPSTGVRAQVQFHLALHTAVLLSRRGGSAFARRLSATGNFSGVPAATC